MVIHIINVNMQVISLYIVIFPHLTMYTKILRRVAIFLCISGFENFTTTFSSIKDWRSKSLTSYFLILDRMLFTTRLSLNFYR